MHISPTSAAGYLLEESRLIAFAEGQRVSGVWASSLLVTSPFSLSNRSYGCLQSSARSALPPPPPLQSPQPSNTLSREPYFCATLFSVYLPGFGEDAMNNGTSLMDLQVGWRFTKGQHISETRAALWVKAAVWGYAKCPRSARSDVARLSFPHLATSH